MQNDFIEFFYRNSFNNENIDFLGDFWSQFWAIFANKMVNNTKVENLFDKEQKNIIKQTYVQNNFFQNFINENKNKENKDLIKPIKIPSDISKIPNENNIGEIEDISYTKNNQGRMNKNNKSNPRMKNNNNYYGEEEDEEEENDIEKEMDEANDIHFNGQNSPNIIKQEKGQEMNNVILANYEENEMPKNIYPGFHNNNSLSNLDFNVLNENSNVQFERNMSAIPLSKNDGMKNNNENNNDYDI